MRIAAILLTALLVGFVRPAFAQSTAGDRGYITAAADFLVAGSSFSDEIHPIEFGEPATITTTYQTRPAFGFNAGGGVRVWRRLSAGVELSRVTRSGDAAVDAQVPHPFFFGQPRTVSGTATGVQRAETAIHVVVSWTMRVRPRWQLTLGGGPTWMDVEQDLVQDISVSQTYPYDTAAFASATTSRVTNGHIGFNAGIEADYRLRPHAALAAGARYSHATVPLGEVSADAGGLHVSAGLRLRF